MHASKIFVEDAVAEVDFDFSPFLKRYKDGRIERLLRSPPVAASENPRANRGVATRDVVIDHSTGVSARLFLPSRAAKAAGNRRLPLVVYIHGGSFCTESAFCRTYHSYATSLAASAGALVVSVEYRLATAQTPRARSPPAIARAGTSPSTQRYGPVKKAACASTLRGWASSIPTSGG